MNRANATISRPRNAPSKGLALVFTALSLTLGLLIAAYWFWSLEPRLVTNERARTTALVQAQARGLAVLLSETDSPRRVPNLERAMDTLLLIHDPATGMPMVRRIQLQVDYAAVTANRGELDLQRGDQDCNDCLDTEIPLYHQTDHYLIGIARFSASLDFLDALIHDVREKLIWVGAAIALLIALAWAGTSRLLHQLYQSEENLRKVFEASPFPMLLHERGRGDLRQANRAAIDYLALRHNANGRYTSAAWRHLSANTPTTREDNPKEIDLPNQDGKARWALGSWIRLQYAGTDSELIALADITRNKTLERQLAQQKGFLQAIIDGVADPLFVLDLNSRFLLRNHASRQLADELIPKADLTRRVIDTRAPVKQIHAHRTADGTLRQTELLASPLHNAGATAKGVIVTCRDITEHLTTLDNLKRKKLELQHLAEHDLLTGLPNRFLFNKTLHKAVERAGKGRGTPPYLALLFLDLDRFKTVNDSLGHDAGDELLRITAERLHHAVREQDTCARFGGDEFVVLLQGLQQPGDAEAVAQHIIESLQRPTRIMDQPLHPASSIGISIYPTDAIDAKTLLQNADKAMYQAKQRRPNQIRVYRPEYSQQDPQLV